jgi:Clostripain family.
MYSGHSNGQELRYVNGTTSHRVATLADLKRKFLQHKASLKVVCFDSCFMSNIDVMKTVSPYCKYVLSSPGFHPNFSYLLTKSFYHFPSSMERIEKTRTYLSEIQKEFTKIYQHSHVRYTCAALFNSKNAKKFYRYMVRLEENNKLHLPKAISETGEILTTILTKSNLSDKVKKKVSELFHDAVISRKCFRYVPFFDNDIIDDTSIVKRM